MAALTTLAGFAIFARHPIPSLREFGIYSGFGLTVIVAASLAAVPAVLQLLPLPRRHPRSFDRGSRLSRLVEGSGRFAMERRRAVLAAWALVVVLGLWGLGRIRVETDYLRFFDAASAVRVDNARIAAALSGTQLLSIVVEGGAPETMTLPETLAALRELQRFTDAQPGVDKTISLLDYLDTLRETIEPGSASRPFVSQRAVHELLILLDPRDLEHNVNADYSRTNLTAYTHLFASTEVRRFIDDVESFAAEVFPAGVRVHATGTVALLNRSSVALAEGQFSGLQQMFLVLTVLLAALFRSLRLGLLAMVPNVVPVVALFGVMGWASIDLNIATSLIAVVAVGIAVDDTIHYLTTFRSEMALSGDRWIAVERTLQLVGRPILITTVALCAGFLVPCVSTFQPIRQFGLLTSFTMAVALLADLLLLPALLATFHVGDSRQAREGESGRGRDCSARTPGLGSSRMVSGRSSRLLPTTRNRMRLWSPTIALALLVAVSHAARAGAHDEEARSLVKRVIDSAPEVPFVAENKLTTPGNLEREFTSSVKPLGDEVDGHYLEVTAPLNVKDIRYLFYERTEGQDEQFAYMPSMRRVVRLTEKSRREPFLGSTFYVTDMVAPALDDFTYDFVGEEEVGGRKCRLVQALPKHPEKELYGKSISAIDPVDLVVMRTEFFDQKGKAFKVHHVDRIEKIDGYWTPLLQRMQDVQDRTESRLETTKVEYNAPLDDDVFHIAHLGR
jgi:hypothetical protein